jgi:hypothetical protein
VKKMNVKLLRKVQRHILAVPERYDQDGIIEFGDPGMTYRNDSTFPECGTIACIGGWVEVLSAKRPRLLAKRKSWGGQTFLNYKKLGHLLGVDQGSVSRLVAYSYDSGENAWPAQFRRAYRKAKTQQGRTRVAARRIDHFIKTRGAE